MGIKHTPGPWIVCTPSDSTDYLCIEEDSQLVGEASTIAEVNLGGSGISEQIGSGNARLIAAAPELLEALRKADALLKNASDTGLLDLLAGYMHPDEINGACDAVIAAIAKATGEPVA